MSERRPFDLTFGFAPSASETAKRTVAIKAWLARAQATSADIRIDRTLRAYLFLFFIFQAVAYAMDFSLSDNLPSSE